MKKQINLSAFTGKNWPVAIFLFFGLLLGLCPSATAADSLLYKGALLIPGTNQKTDQLSTGQSCTLLQNDRYTLNWQSDGNLVLYFYDEELTWASITDKKGMILTFSATDGKLAIKDAVGGVVWSAGDTGGNLLKLQADGNLVLLGSSGHLRQSNTNNGTNIQLYDCNGTNAQNWTYDGYTRSFRSWVNSSKCIDISNGGTADGTNIQLWDCQLSNHNQQFIIGN